MLNCLQVIYLNEKMKHNYFLLQTRMGSSVEILHGGGSMETWELG